MVAAPRLLLHEALIISQDHAGLNLTHGIEGHAHDDEQRGGAHHKSGYIGHPHDEVGHDGQHRQKQTRNQVEAAQQAAQIFGQAFAKDPQFAQFSRSLDAYKASFNKKSDVMVVDQSSEFFKSMRGSNSSNAAAPAKK